MFIALHVVSWIRAFGASIGPCSTHQHGVTQNSKGYKKAKEKEQSDEYQGVQQARKPSPLGTDTLNSKPLNPKPDTPEPRSRKPELQARNLQIPVPLALALKKHNAPTP